jgi:phage terminase small subunit
MPALENPTHERFCLLVASGRNQIDAYRLAFKVRKPDTSNASKLARSDECALRIRELQEEQRKRIGVSLDALLRELNAMYRLARRSKQPGAGVQATMAKAKLLGFVVDRAEVEGTMRRPLREPSEVKKMSLEEWSEKFQAGKPQ